MIIDLATSVRYGNYKQFKKYGNILADRVLTFEDKIRGILNLPDKIHIRLRPMRFVYGTARYIVSDIMKVCSIEIDIRQKIKTFDNTLIHELVHAEQYYEDRLAHTADLKWFKWKGEDVSLKYQDYKELPWEAEAYARADYLTPIIFGYK